MMPTSNRERKILIIGASGYLGYYLALEAKKDYQVFGTYNFRMIKIPEVKTFLLDKTDYSMTKAKIMRTRPDVIVDCAALHNADFCESNQEDAFSVNSFASLNIAKISKQLKIKYVYISTDYVFDGKDHLYTEKSKPNPINIYGLSKHLGERLTYQEYPETLIIRTSDIYGIRPKHLITRKKSSSMKNSTFAEWVISNLKKRNKIFLFTDQRNNSTYVRNLAKMILEVIEINRIGVIHLTGKTCQSRYEQGLIISEIFELDESLIIPTKSASKSQIAKRPKNLNLPPKLAEKILTIKPLDCKTGIQQLFFDYRKR